MSGRSRAARRSRRPARRRLNGSDGAGPGAAGTIGRARRFTGLGLKGPQPHLGGAARLRRALPRSVRQAQSSNSGLSDRRCDCEKYKLVSACIARQQTVISCISQGREAQRSGRPDRGPIGMTAAKSDGPFAGPVALTLEDGSDGLVCPRRVRDLRRHGSHQLRVGRDRHLQLSGSRSSDRSPVDATHPTRNLIRRNYNGLVCSRRVRDLRRHGSHQLRVR